MQTASAEERNVQAQSAAEAVQALTQEAAALAAKLSQLTAAVQQSSSNNFSSTLQHLALYDEAVHNLQANTTAAIRESLEMQQACLKLYNELEGIDGLAKDVHSLRKKVERLESDVTAKLRVR